MMKLWQVRLIAAAATLALGVGAFFVTTSILRHNRMVNFTNHVRSYQDDLDSLITGYEHILDSAQLLVTPQGINQSDWDKYFSTVKLSDYAGLNSVSFSLRVKAADRFAYEQAHQRIYPAANKDEYLPVSDLAPITGLETFLGFDTSSIKPGQYKWIELARDTGLNQRTDAYNFTADPKVYGLFEVLPAYNRSKPVSTPAERREAYVGAILANFKVDQLVQALATRPEATNFNDLEIYDSTSATAAKLLDRDATKPAGQYAMSGQFEEPFAGRPLVVKVGESAERLGYVPSLRWLWLTLPLAALVGWLTGYIVARKRGNG